MLITAIAGTDTPVKGTPVKGTPVKGTPAEGTLFFFFRKLAIFVFICLDVLLQRIGPRKISFFIISYLSTLIDSYFVANVGRASTSSCDNVVLFGFLTPPNNGQDIDTTGNNIFILRCGDYSARGWRRRRPKLTIRSNDGRASIRC